MDAGEAAHYRHITYILYITVDTYTPLPIIEPTSQLEIERESLNHPNEPIAI